MKIMPMSDTGSHTPARPGFTLRRSYSSYGISRVTSERAAFDLSHTARAVRHELEDHRLERALRAPILFVSFQTEERIALILVHHVGAGADRLFLEPFRADLLVVGLRQNIAGQERHPFEDCRIELLDVGGDAIAVDLVVAETAPDELNRIAGLRVARALQRPNDVSRRKRRTVVPDDPFAHVHPGLGLVVVPAPFGQKPGSEGKVWILADVLIVDRPIDRLDGRIDRGGSNGRIERRKIDVIGDRQRVARLRGRDSSAKQKFG